MGSWQARYATSKDNELTIKLFNFQAIFSTFDTDDFPPEPSAPSAIPVGHVDMADHTALANVPIHRTDLSDATTTKYTHIEIKKEADVSSIDFQLITLIITLSVIDQIRDSTFVRARQLTRNGLAYERRPLYGVPRRRGRLTPFQLDEFRVYSAFTNGASQ